MEALKTWLLVAAVLAIATLGLEVRNQARTIERLAHAEPPSVAKPESPKTTAAPVQTSALPISLPASKPPAPADPPAAAEFDACSGDLARYKAGLDKCVVALNAVASTRREVTTFVLPPAPQPSNIVALAEPYVLPSGNQVVVSGRVFNRGGAAGEATLMVTLLEDGRRVDSDQQRLRVGAGQMASWQQAFRWDGHEGRFSAQVELIP
jgi:hypothetical protein